MSTEEKSTPASETKPTNILTVWILITRILSIGSILPWGGLAFCSLISYPSDDRSLLDILSLGLFYAYPIIILTLAYYARTAYNKDQHGVALTLSTVSILPLIWFVFYLLPKTM